MTPKQALDRVIDVSHKMHIYFDQIKAIICMIIDHMESKAEKNETVIINQDQYDKMMYMMTEIQYIEHCIRIDSQLKIKI